MNVAGPGAAGSPVVKRLSFHLGQHDHEQERDDDRAGVDDDRAGGQERCARQQEKPRRRDHDHGKPECAVNRVSAGDREHAPDDRARRRKRKRKSHGYERPGRLPERRETARAQGSPTGPRPRARAAAGQRRAGAEAADKSRPPRAQRPEQPESCHQSSSDSFFLSCLLPAVC